MCCILQNDTPSPDYEKSPPSSVFVKDSKRIEIVLDDGVDGGAAKPLKDEQDKEKTKKAEEKNSLTDTGAKGVDIKEGGVSHVGEHHQNKNTGEGAGGHEVKVNVDGPAKKVEVDVRKVEADKNVDNENKNENKKKEGEDSDVMNGGKDTKDVEAKDTAQDDGGGGGGGKPGGLFIKHDGPAASGGVVMRKKPTGNEDTMAGGTAEQQQPVSDVEWDDNDWND